MFRLLLIPVMLLNLVACGVQAESAAKAPQTPRDSAGYGYEAESEPLNASAPAPPVAQVKADDDLGATFQASMLPAPERAALAAPAEGTGISVHPAPGTEPLPPNSNAIKHARPLLIYDGTLTLAVFESAKIVSAVEVLARENAGYLVHRKDDQIKIRVPAADFNRVLNQVAGLGDELHREVNVRDVTEEFADVEARLRSARAVRDRLETLLARSQTTPDALAVERELQRVTGEIEAMLGRLKVLRELVAFSTITVNFNKRVVDSVGHDVRLPFPWLYELGLPELLAL